MKCYFCEDEARGACADCSRGICLVHGKVLEEAKIGGGKNTRFVCNECQQLSSQPVRA